eukprot:TRINITY_DN3565_c0_g1_i1.p1 TRINITY_DN3565_c0_g1~~TRINITY_DN3565_c0_g1_i1.p1  ORF type:complete len:52 (+),score=15.33 TRINITY_DN3565_c0_g1_i1:115-270(+)
MPSHSRLPLEVSFFSSLLFLCLRHKLFPSFSTHVLCVDTGRSSETAKAHRG